jgi:hypothetical protein
VLSFNGQTGAVSFVNYVSSVNGATGAVTISPAGSTGYIQYHTGAGFSADDGLFYTSDTETLTIGSGTRRIEIVPGADNFVSAIGNSKLRLTQSAGNEITIGDFDGAYGGNNTYLEVYDQTSTVSIFASNFNCQAATVMPFGLSASSLFISTGATFAGNISAPNIVTSVNGATGTVTISPAGSTGYIQYHTGAGFSADDGLQYDSSSETLRIGGGTGHNKYYSTNFDNFVEGYGNNLRIRHATGKYISIGDNSAFGSIGNGTYILVSDNDASISLYAQLVWTRSPSLFEQYATFDQYVNLKGGLQISGSSGTNGQVLTSTGSGITWATASSGGGTKTYEVFTPLHNQPPASNYATIDTRNSIMVLEFDAATDESAVFVGVIPEAASLGSGLKIRIHWMADTATSGTCRWGVQIERMNTDEDSDSFDTAATAGSTTNGTSGIITTTEITITTIDSVAAGGPFRLKVFRDADGTSGTDDMTGDAQLVAVEVRSAS